MKRFLPTPEGAARRRTPEYIAWCEMRYRCSNPNTTGYEHYGGRGIRVCPQWEASFEAFYEDMGARPGDGYSLDRVNVNGDYEPGNCRWATAKEQARNKRDNVLIEMEGESLTAPEWSERFGVPPRLIRARIRLGWPVERAIRQVPRRYQQRLVAAFGRTETVAQWSSETGLARELIHARVFQMGWDAERALTEPSRSSR